MCACERAAHPSFAARVNTNLFITIEAFLDEILKGGANKARISSMGVIFTTAPNWYSVLPEQCTAVSESASECASECVKE